MYPMNRNFKPESGMVDRIRLILAGKDVAPVARQAGIPTSTMGNIMQGGVPRADTAVKLAQALGCSVEWLITGEGSAPAGLSSPTQKTEQVREASAAQYLAVGDRIRRAQASLEDATQAVAVIPDDALKQLLLTWLVRHDLPVEEVAMLLDAKASQGGSK